MSTQSATSYSSRGQLFAASCISLIAAAMVFAVRGAILGDLAEHFGLTNAQIGWVAGFGFWGFTISILIGGALCDWLGMKAIMILAFIGHLFGTIFTIYANGLIMLAGATLLIGIGHGFVEGAINPLVATIYADKKTVKLNFLHAWWPGGIVIGSVIAYYMSTQGMSWQAKQATILVPTIIYGLWFLMLRLPSTERVQSGVSTRAMYSEMLRPLFIVFFIAMWITAATELGTNQWIGEIMDGVFEGAGVQAADDAGRGILILAWISGIMLVGRLFAGPVVKKLTPVGLLMASAAVSIVGLIALSRVNSMNSALVASFVFAVGVCYFWPTMLGVTSERFPKGGALLLGLMGAAGMASAGLAQPLLGKLYDLYGASGALQYVAALPVIVLLIFGLVFLRDQARGGYKAEMIVAQAEQADVPTTTPASVEAAETEAEKT